MSFKAHYPLPLPNVNSIHEPKALTMEQEAMYEGVLAHFSREDYVLPWQADGRGALSEDEKFWLTCECILRFLRATKWRSANTAIKRMEATLRWRRDFGLYTHITPEHVEPEAVTGKEILLGYDTAYRPALYTIYSRQNTEESERQIEFFIFMLECAIDLMAPGVEEFTWLFNSADKAKKWDPATSGAVFNILQTHYPERLGLMILTNLSPLLSGFMKLTSWVLDSALRAKILFNPKIYEDNLFSREQMMKEGWGGLIDFEHDHNKYWPALIAMCSTRREACKAEWRRMGGRVGLKEWEYKSAAGGLGSYAFRKEQQEKLNVNSFTR